MEENDSQENSVDILQESSIETKKSINIVGVGNRYQIKKLTNKDDINKIKLRKESQKWKLTGEVYERKYQLELLYKIHILQDDHYIKLMKQQIEKKINNYKQQDINKKIYDSTNIINFEETLQKLIESNLLCYYCNKEILVLYEIVRENYQWTLDRIDNSHPHNSSNVVLSCLKCNLERRSKSQEKFIYTKTLQLTKMDN